MCLLKREKPSGSALRDNNFSYPGLYKVKSQPYSSRPQRRADVVTRNRWAIIRFSAQVAELVDALVSGISDRKIVEVRVFSWAPNFKKPSLARFFIACRKAATPDDTCQQHTQHALGRAFF